MSSSPEGKIVKTVKGKDIQYGFPKGTIVTTHHCTQVMRVKIKVVYFFRMFFFFTFSENTIRKYKHKTFQM